MQHSAQPLFELEKARAAIQAMRDSKTPDEFEENWKEFLGRTERVWNKASHHFGKSPKWNGWKGKFEGLRKSDQLLSYLVNARGADEHTVNEIVTRELSGIGINPAEGNSLHIERMAINHGKIVIHSPQKIKIDFIPGKMALMAITNRGRTYPVPTSHLGASIDPTNVISIAEIALQFYDDFLAQAERFFVK